MFFGLIIIIKKQTKNKKPTFRISGKFTTLLIQCQGGEEWKLMLFETRVLNWFHLADHSERVCACACVRSHSFPPAVKLSVAPLEGSSLHRSRRRTGLINRWMNGAESKWVNYFLKPKIAFIATLLLNKKTKQLFCTCCVAGIITNN